MINPEGKGIITILQPEQFISDAIMDLGGEEKLKIKWRTKENEITIPSGIQTIHVQDVPNSIKEIDDSILGKAIICEISGRPFRIVAPELSFYRKYGLPIPHRHPDIRHEMRFKKRPGRTMYVRKCSNCDQEMLSVYASSYPGKVYCEACYNKEIY